MSVAPPRVGISGRYRRRFWRVVLTPAILSDLHAILESFGFDVHVSAHIAGKSLEGISPGDVALLPLSDRETITSVELRARSQLVHVTISFTRHTAAELSAVGDDDKLLASILPALNEKMDELPSFRSTAEVVAAIAAGSYLLVWFAPFYIPLIFGEHLVVGTLGFVMPTAVVLLGVMVIAWYFGDWCRFAWVGEAQNEGARPRLVGSAVLKYLAIAIWTILAAVLAQVLGSYVWERIAK